MPFCPYRGQDYADREPFSDDHIVPYAIGGGQGLVIRVSTKANSDLGGGDGADGALINSWFINLERTTRNIKGQSGKEPSTEFRGVLETPSGSSEARYRFSHADKSLAIKPAVVWGEPLNGKQSVQIQAGSPEEARRILNDLNGRLPAKGFQPIDIEATMASMTIETTDTPLLKVHGSFEATCFHRSMVKMALGMGHLVLGEEYSRSDDAERLRTFMWEPDANKRETQHIAGFVWPEGQDENLSSILGVGDKHVLMLSGDDPVSLVVLLFGKYLSAISLGARTSAKSKLRPGHNCVWVINWDDRTTRSFPSLGAFLTWKWATEQQSS